jgi:cytochrome c-type biogenesis protein
MNVSLTAAFLAGVVSFLSPCVLPLVPGYLSVISGASVEELKSAGRGDAMVRRVLFHSVLFIAGFSLVFISLGASATWLGVALRSRLPLLMRIGGVLVILFGLHMTGLLRIGLLYRDVRVHTSAQSRSASAAGSLLTGLAFAFGWTPCIGPILAVILGVASAKEHIGQGVVLLSAYSLGLAVPFLITGIGLSQFMSFYRGFRRHLHKVEVISGAVLIVIGALLVTNQFTRLSGYLSFLNRFSL